MKLIEYKSVYPCPQGFTITNRFIYIVNIKDNDNEKAARYDKFTRKRLGAVKFTGEIRHANDMTWTGNKILLAPGNGRKEIIVLDEMMKILDTVKVPLDIVSLSGVAYDPVSRLTAVYGGDNHKIYVLDKIPGDPLFSFTHTGKSLQSIAFRDWVVYGLRSSGEVMLTTVDGAVIQTARLGTTGEHENIEIRNGRIFWTVYENEKTILYCEPMNEITQNVMIV